MSVPRALLSHNPSMVVVLTLLSVSEYEGSAFRLAKKPTVFPLSAGTFPLHFSN